MKPRHSPQSKENKPSEKRKMIPREEFVGPKIVFGKLFTCCKVCQNEWHPTANEKHYEWCPLNK